MEKPSVARKVSLALALGAILLLLALAACGRPATPTPVPDQAANVTPVPGQTITLTPSTPTSPTPSENTAPDVGAGAEVAKAATLQLRGSVRDDMTSAENLTIRWTQVSGPGPVEFADPSLVNTTAAFTAPGTYVLRLTASDGQFTVSDDVTIVVQPQ
jgi:hypothetical protein